MLPYSKNLKKKSSYKSRALILCPPTFGLRSLMWGSICQALHPRVPLTSLYWASVQLRACAPLPDTSLSAPIKCRCGRTALGAPGDPACSHRGHAGSARPTVDVRLGGTPCDPSSTGEGRTLWGAATRALLTCSPLSQEAVTRHFSSPPRF